MTIKNLYRYTRPDGGVTVSLTEPDVPYTLRYRLIADTGMALTDGNTVTSCVDVDTADGWTEIPDPEYGGFTAGGATESDYIGQLRRLGVGV